MYKSFKKCLEIEALAIKNCANNIDYFQVEKALNYIQSCALNNGKLILTGVGKSGIVARKIASTFSSVGLMSIYLNPIDALHGDIGVVSKGDICILISNSGETQELLTLVPHFKKREITLISIIGDPKSSLAKSSHCFLLSTVDREVCPLNLAPTASTTVALAIGDALTAVWMELRGISHQDFALNHPLGELGKRLNLTVGNFMIPSSQFNLLTPDSSLKELVDLITKNAAGCGYVVNNIYDNHLLGVITDGDLRRALDNNNSSDWYSLKASDLMTNDPITTHKDMLAIDALKLMEINDKNQAITSLPVVQKRNNFNEIIGYLLLHDLVNGGFK